MDVVVNSECLERTIREQGGMAVVVLRFAPALPNLSDALRKIMELPPFGYKLAKLLPLRLEVWDLGNQFHRTQTHLHTPPPVRDMTRGSSS